MRLELERPLTYPTKGVDSSPLAWPIDQLVRGIDQLVGIQLWSRGGRGRS